MMGRRGFEFSPLWMTQIPSSVFGAAAAACFLLVSFLPYPVLQMIYLYLSPLSLDVSIVNKKNASGLRRTRAGLPVFFFSSRSKKFPFSLPPLFERGKRAKPRFGKGWTATNNKRNSSSLRMCIVRPALYYSSAHARTPSLFGTTYLRWWMTIPFHSKVGEKKTATGRQLCSPLPPAFATRCWQEGGGRGRRWL